MKSKFQIFISYFLVSAKSPKTCFWTIFSLILHFFHVSCHGFDIKNGFYIHSRCRRSDTATIFELQTRKGYTVKSQQKIDHRQIFYGLTFENEYVYARDHHQSAQYGPWRLQNGNLTLIGRRNRRSPWRRIANGPAWPVLVGNGR